MIQHHDTPTVVTHLPRRDTDIPDVAALVAAHVRNLSAYSQTRYPKYAPFAVACPLATCKAAVGDPCYTITRAVSNVFHQPRKDLVACWSTAEKTEAYATLVVQRELRRKEADARTAEFEADPELSARQAESRRRTGAAWRQIGAEVAEAGRRCRHVWLHRSGCDCRNTGVAKVIPFPQERGMRPVTVLDDVRHRGSRVHRPTSGPKEIA